MIVREYHTEDHDPLIALWRACDLVKPQNDPRKDIQRKLDMNDGLLLVGELDEQIVASVMAGYEGHRGWINYLAVAPTHRRQGLASWMMQEAEKLLLAKECPKINLQIRETNHSVQAFYESIGYALEPVISMGKRLIPDE